MLRTRLWMGAILIVLTVGMLVGDQYLPPYYPFLFLFLLGLSLAGCYELLSLLGRGREPQAPVCYLGLTCLAVANWAVHLAPGLDHPWLGLLAVQTGFLWLVLLYEMATFTGPGRSVERMATTWLVIGYLGWLPTYFAQLRWLYPVAADTHNSVCLALAAFVPKACDIGAYFIGRLLGRRPMTPVLSPKKTWEGAIGGLITAALVAVAIDRLAPADPLNGSLVLEIGFGLTVGLAGMLGDLAESLIKRDCQRKDASAAVPGFGGVLDVVDAVIYAAPVAYLWLTLAK